MIHHIQVMKTTLESQKLCNLDSDQNQAEIISQINQVTKKYEKKEIDTRSLVYSMRRKMNKVYNQHLRLIIPVLNRYPNFWKSLNESERNAKAFIGWINHMRTFYDLVVNDNKYRITLSENSIDLNELRQGQVLLQALHQAYRKLKKCELEKKIATSRLKATLKDFESIHQNKSITNHYIF